MLGAGENESRGWKPVAGRRLWLSKIAILGVVAATMFAIASSAVASTQARHTSWPMTYRLLKKPHLRVRGRRVIGGRGERPPSARAAIVGGSQIAITQAPWQVFVVSAIPVEKGVLLLLCGGAVLDETHVVTAGHCMFDPETGSKVPPADISVMAGTSDFARPEAGEQEVEASAVRVHPNFQYAAGPGAPDDVAVLELAKPLVLSTLVRPLGLVTAGATPGEGTQVNLTGFGLETPNGEPEGPLNSIGMTIGYSRPCGGDADAVFLCASAPGGSGCNGDSGSGLTEGTTPVLVGVMDTVAVSSGESCRAGSENGFVNVAAPEIRDFLEGSETPPLAPRGGGAIIRAVPEVGHLMTCEPGTWSGSPTFTYAFVNSADGQTLQAGPSSTYPLTAADVGRTIYCQVSASNIGGTGTGRTPALSAIKAPASPPTQGSGEGSPPALPTPSFPSTITLNDANLTTQSSGLVTISLTCAGEESCTGELTLQAKRSVKKKHGRKTTSTVTIGHVAFSIPAEEIGHIKLRLNGLGMALLNGAHGKLAARLRIAQTSPGETETTAVHLIETGRHTRSEHRRAG
jgi:hypothetical protein